MAEEVFLQEYKAIRLELLSMKTELLDSGSSAPINRDSENPHATTIQFIIDLPERPAPLVS